MKHELFGACRKIKPRNVYIYESLTKHRETIAYALRKMKRDHANVIKGESTFNETIYVRVMRNKDPRTRDSSSMIVIFPYRTFRRWKSYIWHIMIV